MKMFNKKIIRQGTLILCFCIGSSLLANPTFIGIEDGNRIYSGNDVAKDIAGKPVTEQTDFEIESGIDFSSYGKSDEGNVISIPVNNGTTGTWELVDSSVTVDYITVVAGNKFALINVGGASSGTWTTEMDLLKNGGDQYAGLSHISAWNPTTTTPSPPIVPEPVSVSLALMGVAGIAGIKRRLK